MKKIAIGMEDLLLPRIPKFMELLRNNGFLLKPFEDFIQRIGNITFDICTCKYKSIYSNTKSIRIKKKIYKKVYKLAKANSKLDNQFLKDILNADFSKETKKRKRNKRRNK